MLPKRWSSLTDESAIAAELFGTSGDSMVASWLDAETARTSDRDFARQFSDHIDLPGISADEYLHRIIHTHDPDLARNVLAQSPDELREWHRTGQVQAITVEGEPVGVLAVAPGTIRWIAGDEIKEEVIDVEQNGHGYAALAQSAWATGSERDSKRLLIGTIDGLNIASRRTAERAGRRRVLDLVFVAL